MKRHNGRRDKEYVMIVIAMQYMRIHRCICIDMYIYIYIYICLHIHTRYNLIYFTILFRTSYTFTILYYTNVERAILLPTSYTILHYVERAPVRSGNTLKIN